MALDAIRNIDKRTYQRYVEKGLLKESEIQSHLKGLPDEEKNAEWVQIDLYDTEADAQSPPESEEVSEDGSEDGPELDGETIDQQTEEKH